MQNKRTIVVLFIAVLLVGAAAFIAGRMLNQGINPLGFLPMGGGRFASVAVNVEPAPELPTTQPEVTGLFVERKDNALVISSVAMKPGGGGVVVGGPGAKVDDSGPKVEVVVTGETIVYRETTEFGEKPPAEGETIQQTVAEGTLDDLTSQSFVTVWGRKSGDRVIAEVVFISTPVVINRPGP
jgi:hypothetical protein